MDTYAQIIATIQSDLNVGDESTFFSPTKIQNAVLRAYRKCAGAFKWPKTMDSKKTSSVSGQDHYEYPQGWRQQSVWKIQIDGVTYGENPDGSPLTFQDFLIWKENNPNSQEKKWSTYGSQYFINPASSSNGNNNIIIWGQRVVPDLVLTTDVTIFSYSMPEGNEAIIEEAKAILASKEEDMNKESFYSVKAFGLLTREWDKLLKSQAAYEKNQPMLDVPDFFAIKGRRGNSPVGDF